MQNCKCHRPRNCKCVRYSNGALSCGCGRRWPVRAKSNKDVVEWKDPRRCLAMGCDCCAPEPVTACGQAEIGGRHIYIDFSGITGQIVARAVEQIFLNIVDEYAATVFQCFSSVGGTDYYDPCERPSFVSEFYRNGRVDYGTITYLFSKEFRIEAEQLAIQITNDINVALASAGLQVTALYRF